MSMGIRATVEFGTDTVCPLVEQSKALETTINSLSVNVCPETCSESVSEFSIPMQHEIEGDLTPIFSHGSTHRCRLIHDPAQDCPCICLGEFGCPIDKYVARNGVLTIVFHAADYEQLREIITELRERFPKLDIKRLIRSPAEHRYDDSVIVERNKLTTRQLEVLRIAYEMGYFDRPRKANATKIAEEIGIDPSTFSEHLSAAQSKILGDVFES